MPHRKALAWLGHSSSEMLELYCQLHDEDSQQSMMALAKSEKEVATGNMVFSSHEGNWRATARSKIEKTLQAPETLELVASLSNVPERAGFEPAVGQALHSLSKAAP